MQEAGLYCISISRYTPCWLSDISVYRTLAPSEDLLKGYKAGRIDTEAYIDQYTSETLHDLHFMSVITDLMCISKYKPVALCCYEKAEDFCHRHIVRTWFNEKLSITEDIKEWGI